MPLRQISSILSALSKVCTSNPEISAGIASDSDRDSNADHECDVVCRTFTASSRHSCPNTTARSSFKQRLALKNNQIYFQNLTDNGDLYSFSVKIDILVAEISGIASDSTRPPIPKYRRLSQEPEQSTDSVNERSLLNTYLWALFLRSFLGRHSCRLSVK